MNDKMPVKRCKRVIALVWFVGAGLLFALLAIQSLRGYYGQSQSQVWSWYLGAVSPTLGLIVAVLAAEAMQDEPSAHPVDTFFYRIAVGVSVVYLLSLWAIVLMVPLRNDLKDGLPELTAQEGQWLGALQGLVTAALGVFYVRKKEGTAKLKKAVRHTVKLE